MAQARITPTAQRDLSSIWDFIGGDNFDAADRTIDAILSAGDRLAEMPGLGTKRDELQRGLLSFPVGAYLIFYLRVDIGIEIVRIIHGQRNLPRIFKSGQH